MPILILVSAQSERKSNEKYFLSPVLPILILFNVLKIIKRRKEKKIFGVQATIPRVFALVMCQLALNAKNSIDFRWLSESPNGD